MNNIFEMLMSDPIIITAAVVLAGTIVILVWALKSLGSSTLPENEDTTYEDIAAQETHQLHQEDTSGLTEARLQAIVNQLNDIGQRLENIEKDLRSSKPSDQTVPMLITPEKMEASFKRLETRIEALASAQPKAGGAAGPDISALEAKLEGIHKLLIYLTDSAK